MGPSPHFKRRGGGGNRVVARGLHRYNVLMDDTYLEEKINGMC